MRRISGKVIIVRRSNTIVLAGEVELKGLEIGVLLTLCKYRIFCLL
jgi:hypothetical protein